MLALQPHVLHATVKAGLPDSCALTSDEPIPSATPTPRKTKDDSESRIRKGGYESVVSALKSLADPVLKQRKMEILIREDARKEKEEERKERDELRKIRSEREEKDHTMKEFEKFTNLLRKSREDLSDTTLSPEDREDLLCTHQLLMNQKKKLQQTLFSIS